MRLEKTNLTRLREIIEDRKAINLEVCEQSFLAQVKETTVGFDFQMSTRPRSDFKEDKTLFSPEKST